MLKPEVSSYCHSISGVETRSPGLSEFDTIIGIDEDGNYIVIPKSL